MDILITSLLIIGMVLVIISWVKGEMECPPPKVIYRFVPKHTLDVQFGEENYPSEIYKEMFVKSSPWIGGYDLGSGKTYIKEFK
jgi:hypothetical protein